MSGSGASNLDYGNISPYSASSFVNGTSSNYAGNFSSNEVPGLPGLAGAKSNIDAVAGKVPGICMNGGARRLKRQIKNITKHYKRMKAGSRKLKSIKRRLRSRAASRRFGRTFAGEKRTRRRRHSRQRGGYAQYMNNMPSTASYQFDSTRLAPNMSALANPTPITKLSNDVSCIDNYNHYTNQGFPSKGH